MSFFRIQVTLSWSKIMALLVLLMAFTIDLKYGNGGTIFMYSLPFAIALITGKQILDKNKNENNKLD